MVEVNLNCEADNRPNNYNIENVIDGKCDIVLNDNITEKTKEDEEGNLKTYYTYDTYRIVKNNFRDSLEEDLEKGFSVWLNFAKDEYSNQAEYIPIEERLSTAEAVIAEILGGEV